MLERMKRKVATLVIVIFVLSVISVNVFADAIPDSYIYANGGPYTDGQKAEFIRTRLVSSIAQPTPGPMYQQFQELSLLEITDMYKYFGLLYLRSMLASKYVRLPIDQRTIENAIAECEAVSALTRVAREGTFSGTRVNYWEGIKAMDATSSLDVTRAGTTKVDNADVENWQTSVKTANAANPIGNIRYIWGAPVDKSSKNFIKVYLNGATTEPAMADTIKGLLFNKVQTGDPVNEISGNIKATYTGLKGMLKNYNGGVDVTSVRFETTSTTNTKLYMILKIQ